MDEIRWMMEKNTQFSMINIDRFKNLAKILISLIP